MLVIIAMNVADDVFRTAVEYGTQIVQGLGADTLVISEFVDG